MTAPGNALLLVGSPRAGKSNSESIGDYLGGRLAERGVEVQRVGVGSTMPSDEKLSQIASAVDQVDLIVLAVPLYIDSVPAQVIRVMEHLVEARREVAPANRPRFAAIVNSGFPEAAHNDTALAIYRHFADHVGFEWAGGLALGGGEVIGRQPLDQTARRTRRIREALDLAAADLAEGKPLSGEAVAAMAKAAVPKWLYLFIGGRGWKRQAREHGVEDQLYARPYEP